MKKLLLGLILLAGLSSASQAQMYARYSRFWDGDNRMGIVAGVGHGFKPFTVQVPTGYKLDGSASTAIITPSIGIYWGMEKNLSRTLSFGFEGELSYRPLSTSATVRSVLGQTCDYSFSSNAFNGNERLYFAFKINRDMQWTIGAGLYENIFFSGKASGGDGTTFPLADFTAAGIGFSLGAIVSGGITYYFNDIFFMKGNLDVLTPSFYTSEKFSKEFGESIGSGSSSSGPVLATVTSGFTLGLSVTIGFKW